MSIDIHVPSLGESVAEATVARWLRRPGEAVHRDEVIAELETEKITVEVTAPTDGVIAALHVAQGESALPGSRLATLRAPLADHAPPVLMPSPTAAPSARGRTSGSPGGAAARHGEPTENLLAPPPQGPKAATERAAPPPALPVGPAAALEPPGRDRRVPLGVLRAARAAQLKEAQTVAAMITTFNDVDLSQVDALIAAHGPAFRARHGAALDRAAFIIRGCVHALFAVPHVNGRIEGDEIVLNLDLHIAVPMETPAGPVAPVLRHAGKLGLGGIAVALADLRARAEAGKLSVADLQGGTFSIADAGAFGGLFSVPTLAAPQSGVLGLHRVESRPVAIGGTVAVRPMMYMSLSYDHRLIDGRDSVTFLVKIKEFLQTPEPFLL
ncbi:2-oxo acid dehydrogenase subunit E2 [Xanthobacter sp. KR7-225]|uniref:2-oxo acid dehydrogenase subunit E2 n=1 Tax=Xanthobacter sp. KR7-225 TaxID=3156613 RepID=UPI0032B5AFEA